MSKQSLVAAVEIAGSQVALAACIRQSIPEAKVSQAHVWKWINRCGVEVPPAEYVLAICKGLAWKITPHQLRPDIYPNANDALPAAGLSAQTGEKQEAA